VCRPGREHLQRTNPTIVDRSGDNGRYFGTPPLRAEMCIAGDQSDVRADPVLDAPARGGGEEADPQGRARALLDPPRR
jgi:hypothetical protein